MWAIWAAVFCGHAALTTFRNFSKAAKDIADLVQYFSPPIFAFFAVVMLSMATMKPPLRRRGHNEQASKTGGDGGDADADHGGMLGCAGRSANRVWGHPAECCGGHVGTFGGAVHRTLREAYPERMGDRSG